MKLLGQAQLDGLVGAEGAAPVIAYVRDCIGRSSSRAIRNVVTQMKVLDTGTHFFPVSVNAGEEPDDNSYVVSPRSTYVGYAKDELRRLRRPWLAWPLRHLVNRMGRQLDAARIDRLVQVNNWLLSTNLYPPDWTGDDLPQITQLLVNAFPDHALCLRSLNRFSNAALIDRLLALGYVSVPSRQVYLFDARDGERSAFLRHNNVRMDAALCRHACHDVVPAASLDDAGFERLEPLYNQLYLDKYCRLNPQFSTHWLRCGRRDGWLHLRALRTREGRIDGVLGWLGNSEVMTVPIVGYDTALPQKLGLYRLATRLCLQEAVQRRTVLNFSSGAAHFKRLRGGVPEIEYSMVYVKHLPLATRRTWTLLSRVLHAVGVPLMRRLQL